MPGEPRAAMADAGGAPWPPHTADASDHQGAFAVMPPAYSAGAASDDVNGSGSGNGASSDAEAQGWPARTERGERADRGEHAPLRPGVRGEVGPLIEALHAIFERDRATASQGTAARCGICYLHHPRAELVYREAEGFYVCPTCAAQLGATEINMVRRQQK